MSGKYIFRYYLPCEPTYPKQVTEQRASALLEFCKKYDIGAVMLYVDLYPDWYYLPDSVEHTKYYVPIIEKLGKKLKSQGISYQLNYQNLFGAWDGGADMRFICGFENYVDEQGLESYGVGCPIGKKFREVAGEKLKSWAKTAPDVLWIDDDIRLSNHGTSKRQLWSGEIFAERLDFGCFCDRHIELFNQKLGKNYTRKEIVDGILSGTNLRKEWLEFQGECANEVAAWIEKTVHEVCPDTKIAVMTSNPDQHSIEGRQWKKFLTNLSGTKKPILRPTFGPYIEKNPQDFYKTFTKYEQLKADIKETYGTDVDFCPEIENTRFTRWAKSLAATGYQIMLGAFLGSQGITLSIYDLEGCVLEEQPEFGELLLERKPCFDKLSDLGLWDYDCEGVGLITAPNRVKDTKHKTSKLSGLNTPKFWEQTLMLAGIACKYVAPCDFEKVKCVAIDKYSLNLLTDAELKVLLAKNVILESGAVKELCERGFKEYIGTAVGDNILCMGAKEIFKTLTHTDGSIIQEPLRIDGGKWSELVPCGAQVLTDIVTPDSKKYPGFVYYENGFGGKVYTFASNGSAGDGFYSNYRMKFLKEICADLSNTVNVKNQAFATVAVKQKQNTQFVFTAPLAPDCQKDVIIQTKVAPKNANFIDIYGKSQPAVIEGKTVICKNANLHMYEGIVCKIEY